MSGDPTAGQGQQPESQQRADQAPPENTMPQDDGGKPASVAESAARDVVRYAASKCATLTPDEQAEARALIAAELG